MKCIPDVGDYLSLTSSKKSRRIDVESTALIQTAQEFLSSEVLRPPNINICLFF